MSKGKSKNWLIVIIIIASFLRLWKLSEVPVSLFGDELDVGYHAYSILKTGRDYQGNFMPLHFHSLAEWRTPLYLYSCVPTVALFGISPLGVRLPAAIFGILGVWGMYLLVGKLLSYGLSSFAKVSDDKRFASSKNNENAKRETRNTLIALAASFMLAISPWHIQYSRAAFEVTQLIAFLIFGLYFFFKALDEKRLLWLSVLLLTFMPWIYSSAKLYTPGLMLVLFLLWKKDIFTLPKKQLRKAVFAGLVVGLPLVYSIFFGGGSQRFGYISVFTDPTRETEIGVAREFDARVRGDVQVGLQPTLIDKLFHNKITFWSEQVISNYLKSFSTDFLFIKGDPNLRHSIDRMGQFYKIEIIALLLGIIFFFTSKVDKRIKLLIGFLVLWGAFPASITREGGDHATRLILILPPLVFLISFGIYGLNKGPTLVKKVFLASYFLLLTSCFVFYQHNFWVHNPWDSERWWHSGWKEAIQSIKEVEDDYDKVIISMEGEPAWIFFAAHYQYSPAEWQKEFPIGNDVELSGFGKVSHTNKYYFGSPNEEGGFYSLPRYIDEKTLYLANAKEVGTNLIMEPERVPAELDLIKAIPYPSGEPAFYLFSGELK